MSHNRAVAQTEGAAMNMVVPTDREPVQTSPSDKMGNLMSEWADYDTELEKLKKLFKEMTEQVNSLSGEYSSAVLYRRYCYKQNMREIEREMNLSRSTLYRIHRAALAEFEKKYQESYKKL
jgi:DNA-directed RNA polymerase specialized sigma subunit